MRAWWTTLGVIVVGLSACSAPSVGVDASSGADRADGGTTQDSVVLSDDLGRDGAVVGIDAVDVIDVTDAVVGSDVSMVTDAVQGDGGISLTPEEFERAKSIYFNRCAGCHGSLRAGATGPALTPDRTTRRGTNFLRSVISDGTTRGMPGWVRAGILTRAEADLLARFIQLPPPVPPPRPLEDIRASWQLRVPVSARPTEAPTGRDWQNYFGVILRDAGRVAIIDGDRHDLVGIVETGFAVHILRSSTTGRYFYAIGRDGRVTLIDLWTPTPSIVATVQGCFDARSVEPSRFAGYEDRWLVEGCYWPPQYVVMDGATLEPRAVQSILSPAIDGTALQEVRVAAIAGSTRSPIWVMGLKESGYVGIVDYTVEGFPLASRIAAERFLHDGGWDHTGRYFIFAANARNRMAVIDTVERRLVSAFETGVGPHPGRGVNWLDPEYGWVNATAHMGSPNLAVYGADPEGSPANAWRVVRNVQLPSSGSLFVKSHPNSPWVWVDAPVAEDPTATRRICVYAKATGMLNRCWNAATRGQVVHFEYNRQGTQVWVSLWDREGEIIVYDDRTLTEVTRIHGEWLVTPTGKFNVWNTAHDVY